MRIYFLIIQIVLFFSSALVVNAQKKPLDHSVYDSWQSLGDRQINSTGEWIAYAVDVQEGDGVLMILKTDSSFVLTVPRGYDFKFSPDGLHLLGKIKPTYKDVRAAKIKKVKQDDFPQDSLFIFNLTDKNIEKIGGVKSFKIPKNSADWFAYSTTKSKLEVSKPTINKDSFRNVVDTSKVKIPIVIEQEPNRKQKENCLQRKKRKTDLIKMKSQMQMKIFLAIPINRREPILLFVH